MRKPPLKEQLAKETADRERAELFLRVTRWYVDEHGTLPPPNTWVPIAGPRGISMYLVFTDRLGFPSRAIGHGSSAYYEEEAFLSSISYDPIVTEERRKEAQKQLDALRAAHKALFKAA
jgi:hypothetical protein